MRIITGKYRGMAIAMPQGIRPTQNRIRKALFDVIGDIEGLTFLELFAGSGAVGFEARSRGCGRLVFVEHDRNCVQAIRRNIEALKFADCELFPLEAGRAIEFLKKNRQKFDLIFVDPPYYKRRAAGPGSGAQGLASEEESLAKKTLQTVGACDILAPNGFVIVQHFKKDNLPDRQGVLILCKQIRHGDTMLSFYEHVPESHLPGKL